MIHNARMFTFAISHIEILLFGGYFRHGLNVFIFDAEILQSEILKFLGYCLFKWHWHLNFDALVNLILRKRTKT